jgi:hypothetical protein
MKTDKNLEKISSGSEGTVYRVKYNDKIYALKISNILKKHTKKNLKTPFGREIYFAKHMHKIYPLHFMKLYYYKISRNIN